MGQERFCVSVNCFFLLFSLSTREVLLSPRSSFNKQPVDQTPQSFSESLNLQMARMSPERMTNSKSLRLEKKIRLERKSMLLIFNSNMVTKCSGAKGQGIFSKWSCSSFVSLSTRNLVQEFAREETLESIHSWIYYLAWQTHSCVPFFAVIAPRGSADTRRPQKRPANYKITRKASEERV